MSLIKLLTKSRRKKESDSVPTDTETTSPINHVHIQPGKKRYSGRCLAFSINRFSIEMAAAHIRGNNLNILEIRKVYLPSNESESELKQSFADNAIDEFISEFGKKGCRVVVTLGGNETVFRTLLMPILRKKELSSAIEFAVKEQIPFPIKDSIYDFRPIQKITSADQSKYKIALLAATKSAVEDNLRLFRSREIQVNDVYHSHDVIGQLLCYLPDYSDDTGSTLLNIGRNFSEIAFYRGSCLEFFLVINTGTSLMGHSSGSAGLEYLAQTLASEIQTAVDFYSGHHQSLPAENIYVYGDLAYSNELIEMLNSSLGFTFLRFPIEKMDFLSSQKQSGELIETAAVCLPVLASVVCQVRLASLLPAEDKSILTNQRYNSIGRLALIVLVLILGVSWFILRQGLHSTQNIQLALNRQVEDFRSSDIYQQYNMLKTTIATTQTYLDQAKQEPSYLSLNLKELSLLTPPTVRLSRFAFDNEANPENLQLSGYVYSETIPPEVILAEYVEGLNASPFYEEVILKKYIKKKSKDGFEIEFHIGMKGII